MYLLSEVYNLLISLNRIYLLQEKLALEDDVCAAEDRASEMSIGKRYNYKNLENSTIKSNAPIFKRYNSV